VDVMRSAFGRTEGFPELFVLDSTDPAQVKTIERTIDLPRTLFIVSSKSGSTLEPDIFRQYFFSRVEQAVGREEAGRHFIAITDPGSMMQHVAERDGFRHIFRGWPSIGGRYSALSDFGLVPAAIMGIDVPKLLDRTQEMVCACASSVPVEENPAVVLGAVLGVAARDFGRDKLTLVASPAIAGLGGWIEQLVAESTGKAGKGVIPIDREPLGPPDVYGKDRLFVYVKLRAAEAAEDDAALEAALDEIERADHPVVRIALDDLYDIGEEFFRWELATAVAGSLLGIHPFDQPDVEASKNATRRLTADYEKTGTLPPETPLLESGGLSLFADQWNAEAIAKRGRGLQTLVTGLRSHLDRLGPGDYFALLAYVEMNGRHDAVLQAIRRQVRDARHVATCLAYGPRFLHSTGQAYKGGPDSGVFVQITCGDEPDVQVPGRKYTFGIVKAAQARGDYEVLAARRRRILRIDVGANPAEGLRALHAAIGSALESSSRG
jgi:transaldolase / glucose-6-phosphate isomerase